MTEVIGAERTFYSEILEEDVSGLEGFPPESFVPCSGTILIVLPPLKEKIGSIHVPDKLQRRPGVGRVAAIPKDDPECPFLPGDMVLFVESAPLPVTLGNRKDLALLHYTEDLESDVLGVLDRKLS